MKFGLDEEIYSKIEKIVKENSKYRFKIFGSRAKNTYKNTSDIDIAVFEERKTDLINATNRLKEALEKEADDITIYGVLHRYEFTFELAWKTLKDYLEYLGISSNTGSPREVLK